MTEHGDTNMTSAADGVPPAVPAAESEAGPLTARRRKWGVIVLVAIGLIAGIGGSFWYNSGFRSRAADDSAIIVTGADLPAFVNRSATGDTISMPVGNYSPYTVTVYQVSFPNAPGMTWDGKNAVIQPGQTADLTVSTPAGCSVDVTPTTVPTGGAHVTLHLRTRDGKSHGIYLVYPGLLLYATHQCGSTASASSTP